MEYKILQEVEIEGVMQPAGIVISLTPEQAADLLAGGLIEAVTPEAAPEAAPEGEAAPEATPETAPEAAPEAGEQA